MIRRRIRCDEQRLVGCASDSGHRQCGLATEQCDHFFGVVGAYTSQGLDSYGHSLGEVSLGGPIIPGRLSFFVSGQHIRLEDSAPYGVQRWFELIGLIVLGYHQ